MKKIYTILLSLACILGFTTSVNAASYSKSITTSVTGTKYEYIDGLPIYYNQASSYDLYILDIDTEYRSRTTLTNPIELDNGFAYIIQNGNVTSSSYKNYYITQVAILWYQDYLNGNNSNISSTMKNKISNSNDTISYYINKLVNNAKNYNNNNSSIEIIDDEITFTKNGNYYYSNVIEVETNNLNSKPNVKLYNAPKSATVVNNDISKDGDGSFQIRIPVSSLSSYDDEDFQIYITGTGYDHLVYKYSNYGLEDAIYGRVYNNSNSDVEASIIATIEGSSKTNIRINVLDENEDFIKGIKFNIYSGDCSQSTCYSNDLVESFTTTKSYTTLKNILDSGVYTLVNKSNSNYNLPDKEVIYVDNTTSIQEFTIQENEYDYNDNKNEYEVEFVTELNDSTNIIKIYKANGTLVDSFRSNENNYVITLNPGKYYIVDTNNTLELEFEVSNKGLYIDGVRVNRINLDEYLLDETTNDKENIYYDEDGTIHINNLEGVDSIDITNKVETTTDVQVNWLSNIIDCPITSLSSTLKYVIGAIILGAGAYLVVRNVKKSKNNI